MIHPSLLGMFCVTYVDTKYYFKEMSEQRSFPDYVQNYLLCLCINSPIQIKVTFIIGKSFCIIDIIETLL